MSRLSTAAVALALLAAGLGGCGHRAIRSRAGELVLRECAIDGEVIAYRGHFYLRSETDSWPEREVMPGAKLDDICPRNIRQ